MSKLIIFIIKTYQIISRSIFPNKNHCVFYPHCSDYAVLSIKKDGLFVGIFKSTKRIIRCNPWQKSFLDYP